MLLRGILIMAIIRFQVYIMLYFQKYNLKKSIGNIVTTLTVVVDPGMLRLK